MSDDDVDVVVFHKFEAFKRGVPGSSGRSKPKLDGIAKMSTDRGLITFLARKRYKSRELDLIPSCVFYSEYPPKYLCTKEFLSFLQP